MLTPKTWITGALYRGHVKADGTHNQICALGAVGDAGRKLGVSTQGTHEYLNDSAPGRSIISYNDGSAENVHAVKRVFKAAIREVERDVQSVMKEGS